MGIPCKILIIVLVIGHFSLWVRGEKGSTKIIVNKIKVSVPVTKKEEGEDLMVSKKGDDLGEKKTTEKGDDLGEGKTPKGKDFGGDAKKSKPPGDDLMKGGTPPGKDFGDQGGKTPKGKDFGEGKTPKGKDFGDEKKVTPKGKDFGDKTPKSDLQNKLKKTTKKKGSGEDLGGGGGSSSGSKEKGGKKDKKEKGKGDKDKKKDKKTTKKPGKDLKDPDALPVKEKRNGELEVSMFESLGKAAGGTRRGRVMRRKRQVGGNDGKTTKGPDSIKNEYIEACIKFHNKKRKKHGASPLVLNVQLSQTAQKHAEKLAKQGKLVHSEGGGENLYLSTKKRIKASEAINAWYNEIKYYNYDSPERNGKASGHFSQMIWRNCKEVGIGVSCGSKGIVVVAHYRPPGNVKGTFGQNVARKK